MPAKKKPIYSVWLYIRQREYGVYGRQAVKANNKKEARSKFKKRFPKRRIIDIQRYTGTEYTFISNAI